MSDKKSKKSAPGDEERVAFLGVGLAVACGEQQATQQLTQPKVQILAAQQPQQDERCVDVDDALERLQGEALARMLGENGRWQVFWCCLLSAFQGASTMHIFCFVFQTIAKVYWCARPDTAPDMDVSLWRNLSQPAGACSILNLNYSLLTETADTAETAQLIKCNNFEFSREDGSARSVIEEFGLVCGREYMVSVVEMCFLAGAAVGSVSSGWISDRFGRKHTLMGFVLVQIVSGTLIAYSVNLAMCMSMRVFAGFASMTVTVVSFVLVVELVSGKWRTITGILNILPVPISYILMAVIAYFVRDWRNLQLAITLPWLCMLPMWYYMPESPRWLLAQGRLNDLYALVERAAELNQRTLPPNYKKTLEAAAPAPIPKPINASATAKSQLTNIQAQQQHTLPAFMMASERGGHTIEAAIAGTTEAVPEIHENPLKVVFNRFYWRTTCLNLIVWLTLIIVYYGLTLHLSNLGGDIYLNTIVAGAIEAVTVCVSIFVVLKVGLRCSLIAYMLVPGICCLATNLVPTRDLNQTAVVALAIIAKCIIGANNAIIPSYTAMQYPTVVRNFGVGMGNLAAGTALMLVPYMWLLEHVDPLLPMSIMGVCGIIGAISLFLMKDIEH
ncbi:solute carrier family 22 member 15 isoform X2 [Bactrocera dorsalis]|uniref:Solute carrier family 22 member 15 isoform X2 n=1 Tax=Bactrocera dorsalis TaxID=27457 RepID=A0A8N4KZH3_BACDO|nr:solute carrier family 22 member 15 isoform X2 [Bactrocera dorsalis]